MASGLLLASQGFWKEDNDYCVSSRCASVCFMDVSVSVTCTVRVKPSLDISRVVLNITVKYKRPSGPLSDQCIH